MTLRAGLLHLAGTLPKGTERTAVLDLLAQNKTAISDVARTILDQLGGYGRLRVMLGLGRPPYLVSDLPKGVQFMWPNRQRSKGNLVKITLGGDDTYDMEFVNASIRGHKTVKQFTGIYVEQLAEVFERQTGWPLKLASQGVRVSE